MATLERVMQMKEQGVPETQIIRDLKDQGITPREINEALSQSKIKSEVNSRPPIARPTDARITQTAPREIDPTQMQQSIMPTEEREGISPSQIPGINTSQQMNPPMPPQTFEPEQQIPSQQYQETFEAPQEQYLPEQYPQENYYPEYQSPQAADIETINDIAEQIVEEKNAKLKKQISSFTRFKEEISSEIKKINQRLERMENVFNELQVAILGKIGGYGEDIKNIAKEMHATQDSFSKIIDPLTDNMRELQEISESPKSEPEKKQSNSNKRKRTKSSRDGFESYLR